MLFDLVSFVSINKKKPFSKPIHPCNLVPNQQSNLILGLKNVDGYVCRSY